MPDIDLKPKGWRWRLPWSHPDDTKLPLAMLLVALSALGFIFVSRDVLPSHLLFGVTALFAAVAGIMFALWRRD